MKESINRKERHKVDRIVLNNISKSYDGKYVLNHFSASFEKGGIYAVMGPSGAGKTTLLRLLSGLEKPDEGEISGISFSRISFVFQEDRLLEYLDAVQNIRFVSPAYDNKEVIEALSSLGISKEDALRPVREYSGGMKRRTAFLRAILFPSDVLFLDEPFKGLDDAMVTKAAAFLVENRKNRTVFLSTHSRKEAELCGAEIFYLPESYYSQPVRIK